MARMDFGLHYSCQSPEGNWGTLYRKTLDQAKAAEDLGYRTFSVAEHHFLSDGWVPTPFVFLGALSAVTDRMNVATNIVILPLHDPVSVAERAAVLDQLSGGSFRLGVALGWRDREFDVFGVDKRERVSRTEEGIGLVGRLLSEETVTHHGDFFDVDGVTVMPRPVQDSVPIWYGGQSEPAIRRAARLADGWSVSPIETKSELERSVGVYRTALEENGRSIADVHVPLRREVYVAEDDETAWQEVGPSLLYEYRDVYGEYDDIDHSFQPAEHEEVLDELRDHAEDRFVIGDADTAIDELTQYRDIVDPDEVLLRMHFPGLDPEKAEKSMRIIADEVMPHFE